MHNYIVSQTSARFERNRRHSKCAPLLHAVSFALALLLIVLHTAGEIVHYRAHCPPATACRLPDTATGRKSVGDVRGVVALSATDASCALCVLHNLVGTSDLVTASAVAPHAAWFTAAVPNAATIASVPLRLNGAVSLRGPPFLAS